MVADAQWSIVHAQYSGPGHLGHAGAAVPLRHADVLRAGAVQLPAVVRGGGPGHHRGRRSAGRRGQHGHGLRAAQPGASRGPWTGPRRSISRSRPSPATATATPSTSAPPTRACCCRRTCVGATQAAVVDEGPTAPAAAVIASGPQTTGLYAQQAAQGNTATAQGLSYQWLLEGAAFAAVRTADHRRRGPGALRHVPEHDHRASRQRVRVADPGTGRASPRSSPPTARSAITG